MLSSVLSSSAEVVSIWQVLLCSFVSIILGVLIAIIYKKTSKYSKNFLITISLLPILVQTVIIMVNGNLGTSVAILGAFGLVRFRSLPGTSKEILVVFLCMAVGLATGMGHLMYAIIITLIVVLFLILFTYIPLYNKNKYEKILNILIPEDLDYTSVFDEVFDKFTSDVSLETVKTTNMGSLFDITYRVVLNKDINEKEFIDELRIRNGNLKIILTHPLENNEL